MNGTFPSSGLLGASEHFRLGCVHYILGFNIKFLQGMYIVYGIETHLCPYLHNWSNI